MELGISLISLGLFGSGFSASSLPKTVSATKTAQNGGVPTNCTYSLKAEYICEVPTKCGAAEEVTALCTEHVDGKWSDDDDIIHWDGYCTSADFARCSFAPNGTYWCREPTLGNRVTFTGEYVGDAETAIKRRTCFCKGTGVLNGRVLDFSICAQCSVDTRTYGLVRGVKIFAA